jgi:cytochrome P450
MLSKVMEHSQNVKDEIKPPGRGEQRIRALLRSVLRHRRFVFWSLLFSAIGLVLGLGALAASFGTLPGVVFGVGLGLLLAVLLRSPSLRFYALLLYRGPNRLYSVSHSVFGATRDHAVFRPFGPFGPSVFLLRNEAMIDRVLHTPTVYSKDARVPLSRYPVFGAHSVLWGGLDSFWLSTRSVCEEYFIEGYQHDVEEMTEIVRERVTTWIERGEIDLLDEIYRIVLEIRARVFFQTTFGCFDDDAEIDFAELIDRVLTNDFVFLGEHDASIQYFHDRMAQAVQGSTRPGSVGVLLRQAMERGGYTKEEVIHNAVTYVVTQAPTMGIFWPLYRAARDGNCAGLRGDRRAIGQAIKEDMRLHPPVPSLFLRYATQEDTLEGVHIPKGSFVFVGQFFVHANQELWTDPTQYKADRWTIPTGDATEIADPMTNAEDSAGRRCPVPEGQHAQRYFPFGSGAHTCQGRWFASEEMLLVIQTVLDMVSLEVVEDGNLLGKPLHEQCGLHVYSRPFHDVRLKVVPH